MTTREWQYIVSNLTIIEARPDWITAFGRKEGCASELRALVQGRIEQEARDGNKVDDWRWQGGHGWRCGGWRYAERKDGVIAQVSGESTVGWASPLAYYSDHWSRVDYCVTVVHSSDRPNPAVRAWDTLRARGQADDLARAGTLYRKLDGADGVSLGSRTSAYYGRIYAKWLESPGVYPKDSWRWEVEMKRHASEGEQTRHRGEPLSVSYYLDVVSEWFRRWEVDVPFSTGTAIDLSRAPKREVDADKSLEWLRAQVRPTVRWLAAIGREDELLNALGLSKTALRKDKKNASPTVR